MRRISGILATLRAEQGSRRSLSIAADREAEPTAPARAFLLAVFGKRRCRRPVRTSDSASRNPWRTSRFSFLKRQHRCVQ
ncbi:hypothetical protein CO657_32705 (plasmid) [Rhizobium acidisoli]|uniref:Uncharacterized protein n=1 Tax=Rhizobium acidisoli TaxID=1538158 RepID=A0AAE5WU06_9HYPH|nr:hypothetical protein CO657_32705 [Rhizobium acidisoli]